MMERDGGLDGRFRIDVGEHAFAGRVGAGVRG